MLRPLSYRYDFTDVGSGMWIWKRAHYESFFNPSSGMVEEYIWATRDIGLVDSARKKAIEERQWR